MNFLNFLQRHPLKEELNRYIKIYYYEFMKEIEYYNGEKLFFLSIDEMTTNELNLAQNLFEFLNHNSGLKTRVEPIKALDRYCLLNAMYRKELNTFRVFRPTEDLSSANYPVFIRSDKFHDGPLTGLIYNVSDLMKNIRNIAFPATKYLFSDLLIVEYCETDLHDGLKGRYTSYLIDDHLIPKAIMFSKRWNVKGDAAVFSLKTLKKYESYSEKNPHEEWVLNSFLTAGLKYGRIDYGVANGKPQLWEINQCPSLYPGLIKQYTENMKDPEKRQHVEERFNKFYRKYINSIQAQSEERIKSQLKIRIPNVYRRTFFTGHILWRANHAARKRISRMYRIFNPG